VPVAEAGPDQLVAIGPVALHGDGSSDVDDDPLTYRWSFTARPEGSAAVLADASAPAPTFAADVTGTYVIQLIVRDGVVQSEPDTVVIVASDAPPPPPPAEFQLFAPATRILPGGRVSAAVVLETATGSAGVEIALASSDATLIEVPSSVTVPAGETSVWFEVTALTKLGSATISAEVVGAGIATAEFTVSQESTGGLIERAQAAGEITEEQAYVYQVFAAYGWPGLPERFRGAQSSKGRDPQIELLTELPIRFSSLSPTAQEQLAPLLAPPIYVGSWGDPEVIAAAAASARSDPRAATGDKPRAPSTQGVILCSEGSTPQRLPVWDNYEVGAFRIWYLSDPLPYKTHIGTPEQSKRLADVAKSEISSIYNTLHGVFARQLLPDDAVGGCNGGDGKYDIYMYGLPRSSAIGTTYPYKPYIPTVASRSWIALSAASSWGPTNTLIRATLAHELMHAIYFLYPRADWVESFWLTEALAAWAENFVYRNGNTEWMYADHLFSHQAPYKGAIAPEILLPLPTVSTDVDDDSDDQRRASRAMSACSKYVFFFYLQHKKSTAVLRTILEQGESVKSMTAIDRALNGTFEDVWADFVVTAWNDTKNGVKNDFFQWDPGMQKGLFQEFEVGSLFGSGDFPTHTFGLEEPEKLLPFISAPVTKPQGAYVPPAAGHWMRAKFTDASTSFVVLHPTRPRPDGTSLRMQALFKANGVWSAPIDLTRELLKVWCRDRPKETYPEHKLEEIVLIASNGRLPPADGGSSADWDWFEGGSPVKDLIPNLVVSNAGCWQWTGRAESTVELTALNGVTQVVEATGFTFELDDDGLHTAALLGEAQLNLVGSPAGSGTATYQISGTTDDGCRYRGGPTAKAITAEGGGALSIVFTKWLPIELPPPLESRTVVGGGTEPEPPTMTVTCPTGQPVTTSVPWPHWLTLLPAPPQDRLAKISEDGGLLSGAFTINLEFTGTVRTTVNLTAVRK
jgi:hypothetical protein